MSTIKVAKVESPDTSTGGIAIDSGGDVQVATNFEVATIKDTSGNNSSTPEQINQGRAKAWVCFNGSAGAVSIRKAFNVSSVTENATGDYTINFTTAMSDANYAVTTTGHTKLTANGDQRVLGLDEGDTYTTSAVHITNRYYEGAGFAGCTHAGVAIFN